MTKYCTRMRRHYDVASYERLIANVTARMPDCGFRQRYADGLSGGNGGPFRTYTQCR